MLLNKRVQRLIFINVACADVRWRIMVIILKNKYLTLFYFGMLFCIMVEHIESLNFMLLCRVHTFAMFYIH